MKNKKYFLLSFLIVSLCLSAVSIEGAVSKKQKSSTNKSKKQTTSEAKSKKQIINPTEAFYDKIWDKFKVGNKTDREEVIKTLKKIIKDTPDEFMSYYYLGIMLNEEGQSTQALNYFQIALSGFPKSADIHLRMAKILDEKNKKDEADSHYVSALAIEPNNPHALSRVGIMELRNKNYAKAAEYLKKAKELQPDNSETLKALGETWLEQGNYSSACEILEQVLLFDETDANVHLLLGKAYEKNGNHEKAAKHIELAGKYGKNDSSITKAIGYDIGRNLAKVGKYEEAIASYKKEIKKNPNPAQGFYEMAEIFERLEDNKNAIKAYQKAYELDKNMIQGIHRCAELFQENNDKANTEKMLKILKSRSEYKELEMIDSLQREEKEKAERELSEKVSGSDTKDADLESAYLEYYNANKKDSETLKKLYEFYKNRGYYDEAITWYRKYAKVGAVTDYEKKNVEEDLKASLEQDNYYLFGNKKEDKPGKSKVASDELMNLAFNGDNDRQKELALQILLTRKEYKDNRKVVEGLADFYEKRGRVKEASKYISQMKRLGFLTESEAKERKSRLKE